MGNSDSSHRRSAAAQRDEQRTNKLGRISNQRSPVPSKANGRHEGGKHYKHHQQQQNNRKQRSLSPALRQPTLSPSKANFGQGRRSPSTPKSNFDDNTSLPSSELLEENRKETQRRISSRRAKSFRIPQEPQPNSTCPITGLTTNQKQLILRKWHELDAHTIGELGRNIFHTCFRRDPRLLKVLNLERFMDSTAKWRSQPRFRLHLQRFCALLNDLVMSLDEPKYIRIQLREFGSCYAHMHEEEQAEKENSTASLTVPSLVGKKQHTVPENYWDTLVFSINNAAKDLQVGYSKGGIEMKHESRVFHHANSSPRFLLPPAEEPCSLGPGKPHHQQQMPLLTIQIPQLLHANSSPQQLTPSPSPSQLLPTLQVSASPVGTPTEGASFSSMGNQLSPAVHRTIHSLPPSAGPRSVADGRWARRVSTCSENAQFFPSAPVTPVGYSMQTLAARTPTRSVGGGSVSPATAEAWSRMATFLVGQMRFGYEMELRMQTQLRRLKDQAAWEEELERIASPTPTSTIATEPGLSSSSGIGGSSSSGRGGSRNQLGLASCNTSASVPTLDELAGPTPTFDEFPRIYLASSSMIQVTKSASQELIIAPGSASPKEVV